MFDHSKAELAAKAAECNFIRDTLEKVMRLADILAFINDDPITKGKLALKGGTAINLIVFDLPRLSVDIDLDFCGEHTRDEMLEQRESITLEIKRYMASQGYILSPQSKERHSLDSFVYRYRNLGGVNDNIKIEINYSLRSHIFEPTIRKIAVDKLELAGEVLCLEPMELFAAKINALLSRATVRDLYDVHKMIKSDLFSDEQELFRKSIVAYTVISQETVPESYDLARIDTITLRKVRSDLLPVIQKGEHVPLDEMKQKVKGYLIELLRLTDEERTFLMTFKNREFKPELLFTEQDIIDRLKRHPMIEWKISKQ